MNKILIIIILFSSCAVQPKIYATKEDEYRDKIKIYYQKYRITELQLFKTKAKLYCDSLQMLENDKRISNNKD